jgi:chaperonin cofactor prefoldin
MDRKQRKEELKKAINLTSYYEVKTRLKTPEDKEIFLEIGNDFMKEFKAKASKKLKEAGISF